MRTVSAEFCNKIPRPLRGPRARPGHVSLLMHSLYRGRRDFAGLIATKRNGARQISKQPRSAVSIASSNAFATTRPLSTPTHETASPPCTSPVFSASPTPPARLLIEGGAAVDAVAANPTQVVPLHSAASSRNLGAARPSTRTRSPRKRRSTKQDGFRFTPPPRTEIAPWWNYCSSTTLIRN